MRAKCPHCGSGLDLPDDATEATCVSCSQSFTVVSEADTIVTSPIAGRVTPAGQPAGAMESAVAPTLITAKLRVNCPRCHSEFTIPLGATQAQCPQCETPFDTTRAAPAAGPGSPGLRQAATMPAERGAPPVAPTEPVREDEVTLRWMQAQFENKFEVMDLVSRGGMGAIYRARQMHPSRVVALKVMLAGMFESPGHRKRFEREAQAVANLKHPAIVPVYEYGEAGGQPYFTMEFVEGTDLRAYVHQHALSRAEICRLMVRVCDAMHYAHQHGVIHRDLKPTNIMVDSLRRPRILDFGLSHVVAQGDQKLSLLTATGDVMGTPRYMSPEQAMGLGKAVDERADVYSLGVILYELIVGVLPYPIEHVRGLRALDVLRAANALRPSALHADMPRDLEVILLKAVQKDKEQRYATAEALARDLESFLASRPISARPATISYRLNRWAWRNRKVLLPVTVLLAVIIVGGGLAGRRIIRLGDEARTAREVMAFDLRSAASVRSDVATYLSQQRWADAVHVAEIGAAKFRGKGTEDLPKLAPKVLRLADWFAGDQLAEFDEALDAQDYAAAKAQAQAMQASATEMPSDELRTRMEAVMRDFPELCWRELQEGASEAWDRAEALQRVDAFLEQQPTNPHVQEARLLRDELADLPDEDYLRRHEESARRALSDRDYELAARVLDSADRMAASLPSPEAKPWRPKFAALRQELGSVIWGRTVGQLGCLATLEVPGDVAEGERLVKALAFSADGKLLAMGAENGALAVLSAGDGRLARAWPMGKPIRSTAFSPDGRLLAAGLGDGTVVVLSLADGKVVRTFAQESPPGNRVTSLEFSTDGAKLLAGTVKTLHLWDARTGKSLNEDEEQGIRGESPAAFSPDGSLVATAYGADEGTEPTSSGVRVWDVAGRYVVQTLKCPSKPARVAFSPDGLLLATGHEEGGVRKLRLWGVRNGKLALQFDAGLAAVAYEAKVWGLGFSPDQTMLATGGPSGVSLWPMRPGLSWGDALWQQSEDCTALAFSPDQRFLAIAGNSPFVSLWGVRSDEPPDQGARSPGGTATAADR